jgi:dihydrofolate reductase
MGSTTAKDLGKPLRDRINIVISSNDYCKDLGKQRPNYDNNDFIIVRNLEDAIKMAHNYAFPDKEIFIVGGSRLYNEALKSDKLDKIYYTHINQSFDCDNFVDPILNREDMKYEIVDKIKIDRVDIEHTLTILRNVELTFYLITKNDKNLGDSNKNIVTNNQADNNQSDNNNNKINTSDNNKINTNDDNNNIFKNITKIKPIELPSNV